MRHGLLILEDSEVVDPAASTVPHAFIGGEASFDESHGGLSRRQLSDKVVAFGRPLLHEHVASEAEGADGSCDAGVILSLGLGLLQKGRELLAGDGDDPVTPKLLVDFVDLHRVMIQCA